MKANKHPERVTIKEWRNLDPWECCGQDDYCQRGCHEEGGCANGCVVPTLYCNLARYEDARENGRLIELPCAIGTHLYRVTFPYRKEPKVTEYVVKNFRTVGKKHRLQLEVQAINVPGTNWMEYSSFFTSKEEAERKLHETDL